MGIRFMQSEYLKTAIWLICIILCVTESAISQFTNSTIDSLKSQLDQAEHDSVKVKLYLEISDQASIEDPREGKIYAEEALRLSEKLEDDFLMGKSLYRIGDAFNLQSDYDGAYDYLNRAYTLFSKTGNLYWSARTENLIGNVYLNLSKYSESMEHFQAAIRHFEDLKDTLGLAHGYNNIGILLYEQGQIEEGLDYYLKGLQFYEAAGIRRYLPGPLNNIGVIYNDLGEYDKAMSYYERAVEIYIELNDQISIAQGYNNIGVIYFGRGMNDEAIEYYRKSLKTLEEMEHTMGIGLVNGNLAEIHLVMAESSDSQRQKREYYQTAQDYAEKALGFATDANYLRTIRDAHSYLAEAHEGLGRYEKALSAHKLFKQIEDSLLNIQQTNAIEKMKAEFEAEKQDQTIQLQKAELLQKEEEVRRQGLQRNMLFAGLIFALIIVGLMYRSFRIKKKANTILRDKNQKIEELNQTKDRLFSIIAHDLKNPFQSLIGLSSILLSDKDEMEEDEQREIISHIRKSADKGHAVLANLLEWSRSQMNLIDLQKDRLNLRELIEDAVDLHESQASAKKIKIHTDVDESHSISADRNSIDTVFRNLISNAVKYTNVGGDITISTDRDNDNREIKIRVQDTGIGMSDKQLEEIFKAEQKVSTPGTANERGTGLGLLLTKEFVEKNDGTLSITSIPAHGSCFELTFSDQSEIDRDC
jgi:signal transduction histidine kinase/Tfp pilus assembly protein PilF